MICQSCRSGGLYKRNADNAPPGDAHREAIYEMARKWHGYCRGSTWCDCQHVTTPGGMRIESDDAEVWKAIDNGG